MPSTSAEVGKARFFFFLGASSPASRESGVEAASLLPRAAEDDDDVVDDSAFAGAGSGRLRFFEGSSPELTVSDGLADSFELGLGAGGVALGLATDGPLVEARACLRSSFRLSRSVRP